MSDQFIFKSSAATVIDNGSGMFEDPLLGLTMPRVLGLVVENGFEDPLLGAAGPQSFSLDDAGTDFLVPVAFEDPLLG